ncbi:insulin-induced gene 1 protein [Micropterus salmoides]|uniref:insulin-induced gene 1 protein n=1 Tax=Micropterus salmoides TaxID=27706 RepID=UPI0018EAC815|nr:insulin-induced gene 1 protein [Micropterus salmoides]XP_038585428.1 insulin-induced gene 1 protein [Micropterus salmoides]XP_045892078.1 insulin-induced gene 1 protein [Micropterus dolomieu]
MNRSGFSLDQILNTSGDQAQKCQMPRLEDHCWSCSCASRVETKHSSEANWLASKAEEMMSIITSVLRSAYGSLHNVRTANLIRRGLVLFTVGAFLALVLNLLQIQRHVTLFPEEVMTTLFSSAWWIPPCCGTGAAVVGLLYPCLDSHLGEPHKFKREWASVMRCIAVFVGINHASVKLDFDNNVQLSLTLAALSLGLWWTFDRSRSGFGLGITTAFLATVITQLLVYNGVYQYTSPDFLYVRSWLPCIFFSGGVTVGNIGRQLAMGGVEKPHMD